MRASVSIAAGVMLAAAAVCPALAGETIIHTYDVHGRLVGVSRSGTVNDGIETNYSYDDADNRTGVTVGSPASPAPPAFSVADASVTEGGSLVFTVTKSGTTASSFSVDYATSGGTATTGSDFTAASGTLSFTSTQTSRTVSIATLQDSALEGNETLLLTLSNASGGAAIADGEAIGTIVGDEFPNQPPTTVDDTGGINKCAASGAFGVTFNDSDPEGNTPLVLIAVTAGSLGQSSVASSTSVGYVPYGGTGTDMLTYTVRDSLGASSTGKLTISVVQGNCPTDPGPAPAPEGA